MSDVAKEIGKIGKLLFYAYVLAVVVYTYDTVVDGVLQWNTAECVGLGYPQYLDGHCIRTVNGTDQVVPLEQLRENQDVQATD